MAKFKQIVFNERKILHAWIGCRLLYRCWGSTCVAVYAHMSLELIYWWENPQSKQTRVQHESWTKKKTAKIVFIFPKDYYTILYSMLTLAPTRDESMGNLSAAAAAATLMVNVIVARPVADQPNAPKICNWCSNNDNGISRRVQLWAMYARKHMHSHTQSRARYHLPVQKAFPFGCAAGIAYRHNAGV